MTSALVGYRVFIASPGGLQDVRQSFRKILEDYNIQDAIRRGIVFIPIGWEDTVGGMGRPQTIINRELEECDSFILVLHDRWGSSPGGGGAYSSGSEEEFSRAVEHHQDSKLPMEELLVFFKSVDPERLSDVGPQLGKVLEFRKKLEREKQVFFHQFDALDEFENRLRTFLADRVREHEKKAKPATLGPGTPSHVGDSESQTQEAQALNSLAPLEKAAALASKGNVTEAEAIYAELTAAKTDLAALMAYSNFLWKQRRKTQAEKMLSRALELAVASSDPRGKADAYLQLGHVLAKRNDYDEAEGHLERAREIFMELDSGKGLATTKLRLGEIKVARDQPEVARALFESALADLDNDHDDEVRADLDAARAQLSAEKRDFAGAFQLYERARDLKRQAGSSKDLADILVGLGGAAEQLGKSAEARAMYEEGISLFEAEGNQAGLADAWDHLGQVHSTLGSAAQALDAFERAAGIFEAIQKFDSAADAYTSLGKSYEAVGQKADAASAFRQAVALVGRLRNREEVEDNYKKLEALIAQISASETGKS